VSSRCTGHCCQRFHLPYTPEELADAHHRAIVNEEPETSDLRMIGLMVRYVGPDIGLDCNGDQRPPALFPQGAWYTCSHFVDGNCSIYETRPRMCREYPYRAPGCKYRDCTWSPPDQLAFLATLVSPAAATTTMEQPNA
jgi:Fe-S-cluster containining protein